MSQQLWGADVAALRDLAKDMSTASDRLRDIGSNVGSLVAQSGWQGPDQQDFSNDWTGTAHPQLLAAARTVSAAADKLRLNADQQDETSSLGGGPGGPGGPGPGGPGSGNPGPGGPGPGTPGNPDDGGSWTDGDWIEDTLTLLGIGVGTTDALLDIAGITGTFASGMNVLGGAFAAFGLAQGLGELGHGILDGDGWEMADGTIGAAIGGAGLAIFLASNPVGWGITAGVAVAAGAWGVLNLLTPDGMNTTEWIAGGVSNAWNATTSFVGDTWNDATNAVGGAWDATTNFVDDVTGPLRSLNPFD